MKSEIPALLSALLLGAAEGILYDILRCIRFKITCIGPAADLIFVLTACAGIFIYSVDYFDGSLLLWPVLLIPGGFLLYMLTASRILLPAFTYLLEKFIIISERIKKDLKFLLISAKNLFKNVR